MKKWIFSLALMTSAAMASSTSQFSSTEINYVSPDTVASSHLSVKGMEIKGFSGASLLKISDALVILEKVVNSDEFKDRVINFKNTKGQRQFASNKGLSNEEIYGIFMEGKEILQPETPGEMNFYLSLYNNWWSKVIGYTDGTTNVININWKFFKTNPVSDVAANLAHEWTHKIGFDHKSAQERDSAPYAIGYIVGDLAEKMLKKTKLH